MIDRLRGRLVSKSGSSILLETGPFVLDILVPLSTSESLAAEGSEVRLFTHLQWREEGPQLFGFASTEERQFFRLLLQVQGVGPRIALAILAHLPPAELVARLKERSEAAFTTVPGVGKEDGGRILVELGPVADRMDLALRADARPSGRPRLDEDALQALTALGYSARDAQKALEDVLASGKSLKLEEQVRLALGRLTRRTAQPQA
ncbi:MAG: Holliday junction branch migration protein RuvA [Candidatus Eisenbacteria bacterium]